METPPIFEVVSRALLKIRTYFSDENNILAESLRDNTYNEELSKTKIRIVPFNLVTDKKVDAMPAIVVSRGTMQNQVLALQNGLQKLSYGVDPHTDNAERYASSVITSLNVNCVGRSAEEADLLGHEVFFMMVHLAKEFKCSLKVGGFSPSTLSEPKKVTDSEKLWECAVVVELAFSHGWTVTQVAPRLKGPRISLN